MKQERVTVCGITGRGRTKTEARVAAEERVSEMLWSARALLEADFEPRLYTWRGITFLAFRDVQGWRWSVLTDPERPLSTQVFWGSQDAPTLAEAEARILPHLAQLGWRPEDGLTPPEILPEPAHSEFRSWVAGVLAFRELRAELGREPEYHEGWQRQHEILAR